MTKFSKFRPSGDRKTAPILMVSDHYLEYWSLNPLNSYLVYALCLLQVFRDEKIFGQVDHFSPLVAKKWQQSRWLSIIIWYTDHWIHFTLVIVVFRNDSNFLATLAKFHSSGGQRWPKLVVYDNWPVSWHFLAMSTVGLCWISHLYPNVHIYWETHTVYECISKMFYTWWKYTVSPFSYILL